MKNFKKRITPDVVVGLLVGFAVGFITMAAIAQVMLSNIINNFTVV